MHKLGILLLLAAPLCAADPWKTTITDSLGNPIWELTDFHAVVQPTGCSFSVMAKNVSGTAIPGPFLGLQVEMPPSPLMWTPGLMRLTGVDAARLKAAGEITEAKEFLPLDRRRLAGAPYPEEFTFTGFNIRRMEGPGSWRSPQELAKAKAVAEFEVHLQAGCSAIYGNTIDKPQSNLTVRETQEIAFCTAKGWYHD